MNQGSHRFQLAEHRRRVQRAAPAVWRFFVQIRGGLDVLLDGLEVPGSGRILMLMAGGADLLALGGVGLPHPDSKASNNRFVASVLIFMGSSSTNGKRES